MKSSVKFLGLALLLAFATTFAQAQHKYVHKSNGKETLVNYEGKITLSDNDQDIVAISDYGFFRFKVNRREVLIKAEAGGKLTRTFYVRGRKQAYEPEGRAWLARELPKLVRRGGFGAESRVARFFKKGGTSAVLAEIQNIESDYGQQKYFNYLLQNHPVKDSELKGVVNAIGNTISSDYYKGKILRKNQQRFLKNNETADAYITAVASIKSSYEKSKALRKAMEGNLPTNLMTKVLDASMNIDSDYEKSKVLRGIAKRKQLNDQELDKILAATNKISSDYEKSKVLRTILGHNKLNDQQTVKTIEMIRRIGSDYESSKILRGILRTSSASETQLTAILKATSYLSSDYEKGKVLVQVGKLIPNNNQKLKDQFAKVARSISSDHTYGKVMRSLDR
ncbi:MAG TPA: hypothetical protein DCS93_28920 [Microscillaceae bacterium]|nr:hypothetical protein [Microscillaceae bacterium]